MYPRFTIVPLMARSNMVVINAQAERKYTSGPLFLDSIGMKLVL